MIAEARTSNDAPLLFAWRRCKWEIIFHPLIWREIGRELGLRLSWARTLGKMKEKSFLEVLLIEKIRLT